jgi:hypothetical protein
MKTQNQNKFECGKCYEHNISGKQIYVCGIVNSIALGTTLIAEVGDAKGSDTSHIDFELVELIDNYYYVEIPKEKFCLNNYQQSEEIIIELNQKIKLFDRKQKLLKLKNKI